MNDYKSHYNEWCSNQTHIHYLTEIEYSYIFNQGYQQAMTDISSPIFPYDLDHHRETCLYCHPNYPLSSIPSS